MTGCIHVVAGLIFREGKLLITKRKPGGSAGGLWEFPGGKVKSGETEEEALSREIREELAVEIQINRRFHSHLHTYPEKRILLVCYLSSYVKGNIVLHDHDEYCWCGRDELDQFAFAPADLPALRLLSQQQFDPLLRKG